MTRISALASQSQLGESLGAQRSTQRKATSACQVRWCHRVHISLKRRYSNNNGSVPIVWARGTLRFCLCPLPFLTMRPGNKWAFISPLFVSEYRCLLSSFDCSELFRGHIVADSVVSAELADVQCSKCRLNFNTTIDITILFQHYYMNKILFLSLNWYNTYLLKKLMCSIK